MSQTDRPRPTPAEVRVLEERLQRVALAAPLPPGTPADDVARGRHRLRRRRAVITSGALVAVGLVGAVVVTLPGPDRALPPATAPGATATDPAGRPTDPAPARPDDRSTPTAPTGDTRSTRELLSAYREVLADHLDPSEEHLQAEPDNTQTSGRGLGTKLGWTNAGEPGLGVIEVFVSADWSQQWYLTCKDGQSCQPLVVGRIRAQVLREDGTTWVGVQRADGSVAVVSASDLFGNNSSIPVTEMDVSEADLARTAADGGLALAAPPRDRRAGGRPAG